MFGFLKDKLKSALGKLTKEVEKDAVVEKKEVIVEKPKEEKKPEVKKKEEPKKAETKQPQVKQKEEKPVKTPEVKIQVPEKKQEIKQSKVEPVKQKEEIKVKEEPKKEVKTEEIAQEEPKKEPEKKGFFSSIKSIFTKEEKPQIKEEEDIIETKEELRAIAEKTDIEPVDVKELEREEKPIKKTIEKKVIKKEKIAEPVKEVIVEETQVKEETFKEIIKEKQKEEFEEKISPEQKNIINKIDILQNNYKPKKPVEVEKPKSQNKIIEEERESKVVEVKEESKGFFSKITETFTKIQISEEKFEEIFWDLEVALLENGVAIEVIDKIKRDLKKELMAGKVSRTGVEELIISTLKKSIIELFDVEKIDLIDNIKQKKSENKPYIISIIGVNGSGKTTSIAKLTNKLQKEGFSVVLAASDTFRAAAIQQLEEHAKKLDVKIVKHDYNSDPAAVAFDAINYAKAKNIDVVLIDTAGRLHSNTNLMRELEKIIRVCNPDIKIFVGESITGNDCVEQAKEFDNAVGIDAIILAKADVDDKGGAAISVSYILKRPILYLGTGQTYDDLKEFDSNVIIESLGL